MRLSYPLYICILIFAPLAFGTCELWSISTVEVLAVLSACLLFVPIWFYQKSLYKIPGLLPLMLLLGFMVLQLVPLPVSVVKVLSPAAYEMYQPVISLSGERFIPLTVNQKATLQEFFRIFSYALVYILTIQLLYTHARLKRTVQIVIGLGAFIGLLAIVQQVGSPDRIYWLRSVPDNASPFGPWINPNQFSGFMEMVTPLALGLFLFYKPRVRSEDSWREKFVDFFTMPGANFYLLLGFAASLMALSVFVSLCRGGILTVTLSALFFLFLYNSKKPRYGRTAIMMVIGCVVLAVSWFGWDTVIGEFNRGVNKAGQIHDARFELWADSMQIVKSFILFGSGFGTYINIYPPYRTVPGDAVFDHAHNDYIELLTDGGIIGFVLAAWFVFAVLRHGWGMIRVRRDRYAVLLGIGSFTGIVAVLMHSVADFNMHNGAVGLYFFFICGLLIASVNSRFSYQNSTTLIKKQARGRTRLYALGTLVFGALLIAGQYGALRALASYNGVKDIYISRHLQPERLENLVAGVEEAETFDPLETRYSYKLGDLAWFQNNKDETYGHFLQAARKSPMEGAALQRLALMTEDEQTSRTLFEEGYNRALNKDELALTYVEYLLWSGAREKAITVMEERFARTPALIKSWSPLLERFDVGREEVESVLPASTDAWIMYGSFLEKMDDADGAEYFRSGAINHIHREESVKPHWFQQLISYYQRTDQPIKAVIILREAVEAVPQYAPFHVQLGDYFMKENITFKAREEYKRALIVDPKNRAARQRLRKMGELDAY